MRVAIFSAMLAMTALPACSNSGMGEAVRKDISAQMETAKEPISACYHTTLAQNRDAAGTMTVSFVAKPETGQFTQVQVVQSDIADPTLKTCVVQAVGQLKLAKPQKSAVSVTYPIALSPSN